jgi:TnpA family transposase
MKCDEELANNDFAKIDKGKLIITPPRSPDKSKEAIKLSKEIQRRLTKATLLDIIIDAEKWLNLSRHFPPLSGNESRLDNASMRFVLTVFCYGTNIGPTETARSVKGVTRKQAAWLNSRRVTEKRLDKAIVSVVNAYKKFALIKHWGDGKSASADGKLWNAYLNNLLSEFHVRHGSYGGVAYYHVSDTYIALFSHFIPCGVYEAIYILDGLLNDESDFNPDTLHGDTQAQSTPVFGLAYLLGIKLMPRIRNIKDLIFYKPSKATKFNNVGCLFKESINWDLIEEHYDDMMLIAMSIRAGKMTASTVLRRFGTRNRKNKVYFAFRELGRVIRTIFLMEYIADQDMRKMINAATCKSEEFNEFARWIFFANGGKIAANCRIEQTKIVKYNHLLANIAALHNVNSMTKIFNDLREEGYPLTDELIAGSSPYHTENYGRLGSFNLNLNRKAQPLNFELKAD